MINYLLDVSVNHPIAMLPDIINHNNDAITNEFNEIFDSSMNRLTKSVYNPTGSVKAHFGEFVNISALYINVKNTKSLENLITKAILDYKFDANNILYKAGNTEMPYNELITTINTKIDDLTTRLNAAINSGKIGAPVADDNEITFAAAAIQETSLEPTDVVITIDPFSYPKNLLYASPTLLKRWNMPDIHYNDIRSGNIYTYYTVAGSELTIDNERTACISCDKPGTIIDIIFNETTLNIKYYKILLSRADNSYVRLNMDPLNRLLLKCVKNNDIYGTVWRVYNYAVRNLDNILLENK